jgi:hypothetical protein
MKSNAAVAAATVTEVAAEKAAREAWQAAREAAKANRTPETMAALNAADLAYCRASYALDLVRRAAR